MKESELTEAERACIDLYNMCDQKSISAQLLILNTAKEAGKKILKNLEPEIKPVFPPGGVFSIDVSGYSDEALIGNAFYTIEETRQEITRLKAQARVIEKINIANEGDNKFVFGDDNYYLFYNRANDKMYKEIELANQRLASWEYLRTHQDADTLRADKEFVKDWKLMKGIKT